MISELLSKKNFFSFWLSKKRKNSRYRWRPQQTKKLDNTNLGGLRSCSSGLFPQTFYLIISSGVCAGGLGSYVKKTRLSWSHEVARLHNTRTCVPLFFCSFFLAQNREKGNTHLCKAPPPYLPRQNHCHTCIPYSTCEVRERETSQRPCVGSTCWFSRPF